MHRRRGHCILLLNLALNLVAKYVKSRKYVSLNLAQTLFQRLYPPTLALRIFFSYSESKNFPTLKKDMECGRFDSQKASPLAQDRPNKLLEANSFFVKSVSVNLPYVPDLSQMSSIGHYCRQNTGLRHLLMCVMHCTSFCIACHGQ